MNIYIYPFILFGISFVGYAQKKPLIAQAVISGTSPSIVVEGELSFVGHQNGDVVLNAKVKGLKPLTHHAIHIHEYGSCDSAGRAAGGHWNPHNVSHGHLYLKSMDQTKPAHKGDIGNLFTNESGVAVLGFHTDEWCINCSDSSKNIVGKAIIIHEGRDDFKTQPTGGAGGRIACGVILLDTSGSEK